MQRPGLKRFELLIENFIFQSRWLLAPFYLGLVLALSLLLFHFCSQFYEFATTLRGKNESQVILGVLGLIDLSFTGNLILIVIFSGYENFVSRLDVEETDRPLWMTKIDFGGLKHKLMASIVAISAIQVLKGFMQLDEPNNMRLGWLVGIHMVFLASMLVIAISDRISEASEHPSESQGSSRNRAGRGNKRPKIAA